MRQTLLRYSLLFVAFSSLTAASWQKPIPPCPCAKQEETRLQKEPKNKCAELWVLCETVAEAKCELAEMKADRADGAMDNDERMEVRVNRAVIAKTVPLIKRKSKEMGCSCSCNF